MEFITGAAILVRGLSQKKNVTKTLKILVYLNEKVHIAQCIEYDISAQGSTADEAIERIRYLLNSYEVLGQEKGCDLLKKLDEAPSRFNKQYELGSHIKTLTWKDCEIREVSLRSQTKVN